MRTFLDIGRPVSLPLPDAMPLSALSVASILGESLARKGDIKAVLNRHPLGKFSRSLFSLQPINDNEADQSQGEGTAEEYV
jgi:hypothetical protein